MKYITSHGRKKKRERSQSLGQEIRASENGRAPHRVKKVKKQPEEGFTRWDKKIVLG